MAGTLRNLRRSRGFTLVEAVIALVIIAAAAAGLLMVFAGPMARSADPLIIAQARSVASAYMDEILAQDYGGPDGGDRATYTTVMDYDGLNESPPRNQFDNSIGALSGYSVSVSVSLEGTHADIAVTVSHSSGRVNYTLRGRRGNY